MKRKKYSSWMVTFLRNVKECIVPLHSLDYHSNSMSYYSYLSNFQMVEVWVGNDAWDALKKSSVGVFPRFYELDFTWSAKVVRYLLTHQLVVRKNYEIWSLIDWQPIRLSLLEFGEITSLNCAIFDDGDLCKVDHKEFWAELNVCTCVGPSLYELLHHHLLPPNLFP